MKKIVPEISGKYRKPKDIVYREVDGDAVLLHLNQNIYYSLNPIGTVIFTMLEKGKTVSEVEVELESMFSDQVTSEQLKQDIAELIADLLKEGLLEKDSPEQKSEREDY
ncbi:MAG: PqqD family protein [bacterium]|nr:PqqD family protein [bacterium]